MPRSKSLVRRGSHRGVELLLASVFVVVLFPVLLLVGITIVLIERRSPFFKQTRVGNDGRHFTMLKFRTMRVDADPYMIKPPDTDPVVTRVGRIIRRRAVDELPQLWNVLRGDMALVGPRPEMPFIVDEYGEVESIRLKAKPGLTGLWQLSRVRDRLIHHHIEYDLFYIYNRSIWFDLWLIWRTLLFAMFGSDTKIRLAVRRWESERRWRGYAPDRSKVIPPRQGPLLSRMWSLAAVALFVVALSSSGVIALAARNDLASARSSLNHAKQAFKTLDPGGARKALSDADTALQRAEQRLESPFTYPGRIIPGVRGNLQVALALARSGREIVAAGREGLGIMKLIPFEGGSLSIPWKDGVLDLGILEGTEEAVSKALSHLKKAEAMVAESKGYLLLPQVKRARGEAITVLSDARHQADSAAGAALLLPRMLGSDSPRTWLIGAENSAELRGRGGYPGAFGTLRATEGKLEFGDFFPTTDLPRMKAKMGAPIPEEYRDHYAQVGGLVNWQNLVMSPHFPSGARLMLTRMEDNAGIEADGLIDIDPIALSYLLEVTGPIHVDGLPEPITSQNVVDWALNRIYFTFDAPGTPSKKGAAQRNLNVERKDELGKIATAVWAKLLSVEDIDSKKLADAVGRALAGRHMVIYSKDPAEQELIERLAIAGAQKETPGDYLLVFSQNLGENKMDYYLNRSIEYRGELGQDGSMNAAVTILMKNTAAAGGELPEYVGGSRKRIDLEPGIQRSYLTVAVPKQSVLEDLRINGEVTTYRNQTERDKRIFAVSLELAPGQSKTIEINYRIPDILVGNEYRLTLQKQATVRPDEVTVLIDVPRGLGIVKKTGFVGGNALVWKGPLEKEMELRADLLLPFSTRVSNYLSSVLRQPLLAL